MNRIVVAAALGLSPALALASAENIASGFNSMQSWLVGVGVAVAGVALAASGIYISLGKQEGKEKAVMVFLGTLVIIFAGGLITLIRSWFGS